MLLIEELEKEEEYKNYISNQTPFDLLYYSRLDPSNINNNKFIGNKYCTKSDLFHLAYRDSIFKEMNFFTGSYEKNVFARKQIEDEDLGADYRAVRSERRNGKNIFRIDPAISLFFIEEKDLRKYNIGQEYYCATQTYAHIPGNHHLEHKDKIISLMDDYRLKYQNKPKCFNPEKFAPVSYRLKNAEECLEFFRTINSEEYKNSLEFDPLRFVIKAGEKKDHTSEVFLLDESNTTKYNEIYNFGERCGVIQKNLIAQSYISNPLLLDKRNKFDLKVYMLIASTNPLIVYYHDGYLSVSLKTFDKFSIDKTIHISNSKSSIELLDDIEATGRIYNGMDADQLKEYHVWTLERLQDYLLKTGKILNNAWLDVILRPQLEKALVHIARMAEPKLSKKSNVFEIFSAEFLLDDSLSLWFIDCDRHPLMIDHTSAKKKLYSKMLKDIFEIEYSFFRSRMKRIFDLIDEMKNDKKYLENLEHYRIHFDMASKNSIEPEFVISPSNQFKLIVNKNFEGKDAYFGNINEDCLKE